MKKLIEHVETLCEKEGDKDILRHLAKALSSLKNAYQLKGPEAPILDPEP